MKSKNSESSAAKINHYKSIIILTYSIILSLSIGAVSFLTLNRTDTILKQKVLEMSAQLNMQMQINLNSYLERIEMLATLAFANEINYEYDDTKQSTDDYDNIKTRETITEYLYNICMMENFVDFGIVYSNNNFVGKISNGSLTMFGDDMYTDLKNMVKRQDYSDGWSAGFDGDYRRIYYVKNIHENAILVLSFYASELEHVFEHSKSNGMESLSVRLIEKDNVIIYSSINGEAGTVLDKCILSRINRLDSSDSSIIDDQYLISINQSDAEWYVICSLPTEIILREKNEVQKSITVIAIIVLLFNVLATICIIDKLMNPVNNIVSTLDDKAHKDLLTGILNKRSFEAFTENSLSGSKEKKSLILLDIDNFKGVNDTLGHEYGDKVLAGVGAILRKTFPESDSLLGRLGGDEFCVLINTGKNDTVSYTEMKCRELCKAFSENYTGDDNSYKISASIGVAFFPDNGMNFPELYRRADKALYHSKHNGKDTYTLFSSDLEESE
ncbi:MAG: GGDEF domain-containing protein [Oscillospiraceae bacterium]|nr:GGDEF domain-containing protein [Oscillospiraceae bacterium]